MAKESRAKSAMSGKGKSKSKGGKKVHKMHIRHGAAGGYVVDHEPPPDAGGMGGPPDQETYPIQDMQGLQDHIAEHMQSPQPEAAPAAPAGPAPAAPGGGM